MTFEIVGHSEAVFLVMCDPSMDELWATYTHTDLRIDLSLLLTASSLKGRTQLKIRPLYFCWFYHIVILQSGYFINGHFMSLLIIFHFIYWSFY